MAFPIKFLQRFLTRCSGGPTADVTAASTLRDHILANMAELNGGGPSRSRLLQSMQECVEHAELLMRNLERAANLISSFKQVAIDRSENVRRQFDLTVTIAEILRTLTPLYKHTPYRLRAELAPDIRLDSYPGALGQILTHLVSNSVLHGFEGRDHGQMLLATRLAGDHEVEMTFSDDGQGMPEAVLKKIFDPFFTTKLGRGSSGLGMHIVYNLITTLLGGKVSIVSEPGGRTMLAMVIPLSAPKSD